VAFAVNNYDPAIAAVVAAVAGGTNTSMVWNLSSLTTPAAFTGGVDAVAAVATTLGTPAVPDIPAVPGGPSTAGVGPILPPSLAPPACGAGSYSYFARGRVDTSTLVYGVDTPITVNLVADSGITLDPNLGYALYIHLESPGIDKIGVAGTEKDSYANGGPYNRQMRVTGPTCLSNPAWIGVAARDVNFFMTLDNGCSVGNQINCGQGICARTVAQCDGYGTINTCVAGSCAADADCCPAAANGGPAIDCSTYSCNVATGVCNAHAEVCNGVDDNCDGLVDNGLPTTATCGSGPCARAVYPCDSAGNVVACTPDFSKVAPEVCDNIDNDCNGIVDDGLPNPQCGQGLCQRNVYSCSAGGVPTVCTADTSKKVAETCDGVDQDCDGYLDNATTGNAAKLTQAYYPSPAATRHVGACTDGVQTCSATAMAPGVAAWTVTTNPVGPTTDVCDAIDNDCDGFVDNIGGGVNTKLSRAYYNGSMVTRSVGRCQDGVQTCGVNAAAGVWGVTTTDVEPTTETCNGIDDDCNGLVDDGLGATVCGLGVCAVTIQNCVGGVTKQCTPAGPATGQGDQTKKGNEICNNLDDDCDGYIDNKAGTTANNTFTTNCSPQAAAFGNGATPDTGICQHGTNSCTFGVVGACAGEVPPVAEICNGLDDNCNGTVDDPGSLSSMCPTPPNATGVSCGGTPVAGRTTGCGVTACAANYYDVDGHTTPSVETSWTNGCECADDAYALATTSNTSTSTCLAGTDIGSYVAGQSTTITGVIPMNSLTDYYLVHFPVTSDFGSHGTGTININFQANPNADFNFKVFSASCGTTGYGVCSNGSTQTQFVFADNADPPTASPNYGTRNYPWPTDVYIQVTRPTGGVYNCESYQIQVSR
jgi:hypothetical protein